MNTIYILVMLLATSSPHPITVEFNSFSTCEIARQKIEADVKKYGSTIITQTCHKK